MSETSHLANGDSEVYWAAARERKLVLQKCRHCGATQFPPRHHCATCWEAELDWVESAGRGTVESFTIVRRAPLPEFRGQVPYVVVAVRLEDGPRMLTNLAGDDALAVGIGDAVGVDFAENGRGDVLPQFRRVEPAAAAAQA
jgi:uncharacterized OB-fold protein